MPLDTVVELRSAVADRLAHPATAFGEAKPVLAAADLTMVNLETAITRYEQGISLLKACTALLREAEASIGGQAGGANEIQNPKPTSQGQVERRSGSQREAPNKEPKSK